MICFMHGKIIYICKTANTGGRVLDHGYNIKSEDHKMFFKLMLIAAIAVPMIYLGAIMLGDLLDGALKSKKDQEK